MSDTDADPSNADQPSDAARSDDSPAYGRETTAYGTSPDHDADETPAGAAGSGTAHGLADKLKQGFNAVTGRDLDTASPTDNERGNQAGGGGNDGK